MLNRKMMNDDEFELAFGSIPLKLLIYIRDSEDVCMVVQDEKHISFEEWRSFYCNLNGACLFIENHGAAFTSCEIVVSSRQVNAQSSNCIIACINKCCKILYHLTLRHAYVTKMPSFPSLVELKLYRCRVHVNVNLKFRHLQYLTVSCDTVASSEIMSVYRKISKHNRKLVKISIYPAVNEDNVYKICREQSRLRFLQNVPSSGLNFTKLNGWTQMSNELGVYLIKF